MSLIQDHEFLAEGPPGSSDESECQVCGELKSNHQPDPRGPGPIEEFEIMEGGQQNIIDYTNQEPLLFGLGQNSSHEYPGKIIINNESAYVDREVKHDQDKDTAKTGTDSVGANRTQPTIPTAAPDWNGNTGVKEIVSIPASVNEKQIYELQEAFDEQKHPRAPGGASNGGQFVSKDQGVQGNSSNDEYTIDNGLPANFFPEQAKTFDQGQLFRSMIFWTDQNHLKNASPEELKAAAEYRNLLRDEYRQRIELHQVSQIQQEEFEKRFGLNPEQTLDIEPGAEVPGELKTKPTITNPITTEPIKKPIPSDVKPSREIYQNLPANTDKPGEGAAARRVIFADTEQINGEYYDHISTIETQQRQIDHQKQMLASGGSENRPDNEAMIQSRKDNIASLESEIIKHQAAADKIEAELKAKGKFEYWEVQQLLHSKQDYVDDAKRRKQGSMPWYKAQGQIMAHDREIDLYRTGKKDGHFVGNELEQHRAKTKEEYAARVQKEKEEKAIKNSVRNEKANAENQDALKRLKAKGFDINPDTGKFNTNPEPGTFDLPGEDDTPNPETDTIKDHKEYLKKYKSVLEAKADMLTLRVNNDIIKHNYASEYDKAALKDLKWKSDHFVDKHSLIGVVMYNDGDDKQVKIYEEKFQKAPLIGKLQVKTITIHKGIGPGKTLSPTKSKVKMGSWDRKGGIELYFASEKYRAKLKSFGMEKDDFDLTGDHEFGHATWSGAKEHIAGHGTDIPLAKATSAFTSAVNHAYDATSSFSIHSYTDSYKRGSASMGKGPDILENEVHSKLREWETSGYLDMKELEIRASNDWKADDYRNESSIGTNLRNLGKVIEAYRNLRKEMYAIE